MKESSDDVTTVPKAKDNVGYQIFWFILSCVVIGSVVGLITWNGMLSRELHKVCEDLKELKELLHHTTTWPKLVVGPAEPQIQADHPRYRRTGFTRFLSGGTSQQSPPGASENDCSCRDGRPGPPGPQGPIGPRGPQGPPGNCSSTSGGDRGGYGTDDESGPEELVVRWGVDASCGSGSDISEVYRGFAAAIESSGTSRVRGAHSLQCVRHSSNTKSPVSLVTNGPVLSAVKVNLLGARPSSYQRAWSNLDQKRLPCIVCRLLNTQKQFVLFGSTDCGSYKYHRKYTGYAMAPYKTGYDLSASRPICVEQNPRATVPATVSNRNAVEVSLIRSTTDVGGSQDRLVPCAVCIKPSRKSRDDSSTDNQYITY